MFWFALGGDWGVVIQGYRRIGHNLGGERAPASCTPSGSIQKTRVGGMAFVLSPKGSSELLRGAEQEETLESKEI